MSKPLRAALAVILLMVLDCGDAISQHFPAKPVRVIVGFLPGGGTDIMARQLGQKLSESLGQPVIVDNRPGRSGIIAAILAKEAPPNGYTILIGTASNLATNVAMIRNLPYDPLQDFAPIALTGSSPYFIVINPGLPANSIRDFIALAKARPGQLNFASSGTGGGAHLAIELFNSTAGISLVHVPYKGAAQSLADVMSGQVHMTFSQPLVALNLAKAGKVKVLAVTSRKRLALWPEAPTVSEAALPDFEASTWQGVLAPAKTPKAIVDRFHGEIVKALRSPDIERRLVAEGFEISGKSSAEFSELIKTEIAKWRRVVKEANIEME